MLGLFQRHAVVGPPSAHGADLKFPSGARNFVLGCSVNLPLPVMDTSACGRLHAQSYTRCYGGIGCCRAGDGSAARACEVCGSCAEQGTASRGAAQYRDGQQYASEAHV
jgi:hypothetical protein